tara:strand:- start:701 stop:1630 length:930 start_codon:yes stop_codon:yes gene_type:complete
MVNQLLVTLVNSVLGSGKATARNNYAYHCPFCHHHKPKLEVNLTENKEGKNPWHCWACNARGTTIYNLFKQLKVEVSKFTELKSLVKTSRSIKENKVVNSIALPNEFISLYNVKDNDIITRHALAYLKNRKLSKYDILKYNIGFCKEGLYKNMIIIPTYNADGRLNYFTARSFEKEPYIKYRNPSASRNIIPNEHLINWKVPIIICEGLFDAIAIKRNAIPLLGKNIQVELMKKIVSSFVQKIYIALDKDATKQALHFCEQLMKEGKEVYLVDLQDKDPSEMGFRNFTKLIQQTVPLTYSSLLGHKLAI